MKKLLYLIPLILLALCATHITLYKDTVTYNPGGDLTSLKPSHWKMRDYSLDVSVDLSKLSSAGNSSVPNQAYSQGAKFYGFPFGFYFKNDIQSGTSQLTISAYSWLWGLVDGLIIILMVLLAFFFSRPRRKPEPFQNHNFPNDTSPTINSIYPPSPPTNIYPPANT